MKVKRVFDYQADGIIPLTTIMLRPKVLCEVFGRPILWVGGGAHGAFDLQIGEQFFVLESRKLNLDSFGEFWTINTEKEFTIRGREIDMHRVEELEDFLKSL